MTKFALVFLVTSPVCVHPEGWDGGCGPLLCCVPHATLSALCPKLGLHVHCIMMEPMEIGQEVVIFFA